jgi:hypothetical protein
MSDYILSKIEYAETHRPEGPGLTLDEILFADVHLQTLGRNGVQKILNELEEKHFVFGSVETGRGEVFRLKIFDTFDDLCRAKASPSLP